MSEPVIQNLPDGTARTFPVCTPADRKKFRSIFRLYRKLLRIDNLRLAGVTDPDKIVASLNDYDRQTLNEGDVIGWLAETEGQDEAILLSLQRADPDAKMEQVYVLQLPPSEKFRIAAGVFNIPLEPPDPLPLTSPAASASTGGIGEEKVA